LVQNLELAIVRISRSHYII